MISAIDTPAELCDFSENDNIYLIKIRSNMTAYSNLSCVRTWVQGKNAVIQTVDDSAVIFADERADFDEIAEFLPFCGCKTVFTSYENAAKLRLNVMESGIILRKSRMTNHSPPSTHIKRQYYPDYSRIYSLLEHCGFTLPSRDDFAADISLRLRKNTARVFCNNDYTSLCVVGCETAESAIISAVAVSPDMRLQGLGSNVLQAACSSLENEQKQIYLYREIGKNERFYRKSGFIKTGSFASCKI
ncbi:MAG: GNAT family N-acetyltransferase [Acutalibacteraceae bacterium]